MAAGNHGPEARAPGDAANGRARPHPGALNLLGCYVHDLRLQCLEYFGKFYQDGGKPFRPMAVNTRYVDIKEQ